VRLAASGSGRSAGLSGNVGRERERPWDGNWLSWAAVTFWEESAAALLYGNG